MFAGDSKILDVHITDTDNAPVDITNDIVRWQLAKTVTDRPPLLAKSVGDGITIVDGPQGRFEVQLDPDDTLPLKGQYYFEAEISDGGGFVATVVAGSVLINPALIDPP
jgi:hypothetical protein